MGNSEIIRAETSLIRWSVHPGPNAGGLPSALVALHPLLGDPALPVEVTALLPNRSCNRVVTTEDVISDLESRTALGLCLVDPMLHLAPLLGRFHRNGLQWIANFPTVGQHEPSFESSLQDVDLGLAQEIERLSGVRRNGFRTLALICRATDAAMIVRACPDAIAYMPDVTAFLGGIPSLQDRKLHEQEIADALDVAGWTGPFLRYRLAAEDIDPREPALVRA